MIGLGSSPRDSGEEEDGREEDGEPRTGRAIRYRLHRRTRERVVTLRLHLFELCCACQTSPPATACSFLFSCVGLLLLK